MEPIVLSTSDSERQMKTVIITPNDKTVSLRVEIRRLCATDRWYISITDAATGESLVQYVPLVSSTLDTLNNLLRQFSYMGIGGLWVIPLSAEDEDTDPADGTLNRYAIVWGDSYG